MEESQQPVVLVGIADDESDAPVLAQALDLTARLHGTMLVTHVADPPLPVDAALPASGMAGAAVVLVDPRQAQQAEQTRRQEEEARIRQMHDEVAAELGLADVAWSYRSVSGDPGHALIDLAGQVNAYCVVVGSRGEGVRATLARLVRPSVSHTVIGEREVPVLVVPHGVTPVATDAV